MDKKHNELSFQLIFEASTVALVLVDYSGKIVMLNKQTEKLFGYKQKELLGKEVEILIPERLKYKHPGLRDIFITQPQARPMGVGRDLFGVKNDGTEIPVEIGLNPIKKNETKLVLASIIDITERKKSEDEIRLYTKKIEDKNKELEQFTRITSHDLREPLNSIVGLIELLIADNTGSLDGDTILKLKYIQESANRMTELVRDLLEHVRLGKNSKFSKVDLNQMLKLVLSDLEVSISESKAKIRINKLPVIEAMELEIRLLFQNLISNAIKYRKPDVVPEINVSAKKVEAGWEFAVSDNGIGIQNNQKEKVFIIFQRLHGHNEYAGTGIGLAHCRKITELHDGRIWVESKPGHGSTFYFFIPVRN